MGLIENEKLVDANLDKLTYSGRIDFSNAAAPIFIFPGSSVSMIFTGSVLKILVKNKHSFNDNYIGYILDGVEKKVLLSNDRLVQEIVLGTNLKEDKPHEITLYKRQDGCHEFTFYGFVISRVGTVVKAIKRFRRNMEFYGDSAAAGELIEARNCMEVQQGKCNGQYSNAWNSYAMMTAKNLKANVNIIAQAGISLLDNAGYFHVPQCIGMESVYDKLHFNPDLGNVTDWDFARYTPHVVVIDIGQNDAVPKDYMKEDRYSEKSKVWKRRYKDFVLDIRAKYHNALIIVTTTIINHHPSWDRAIGEVCQDINDEKIMHFLYSSNGHGSAASISLRCAEQMSFELSMLLKSLGSGIWEN